MENLNLKRLSEEFSDKYSNLYYKGLVKKLVGKEIEFIGDKWGEKGGNWKRYIVTVAKIKPFNSGNPFESSIEIVDTNKRTFNIHPDHPIKIK